MLQPPSRGECFLLRLPTVSDCIDPVNSSSCGRPTRDEAKLFLVSALILYLELVLIRWLGTEIRVFAYLGNLILVTCFFGTGLGCYQAERMPSLGRASLNLLLLVVLTANPFHSERLDLSQMPDWLGGFEDAPLWHILETMGRGAVAALIIIGVVLYLVVFIFIPLGQVLGRSLVEHPRVIRAYSINIAGSLGGIWLFNCLSWLCAPPVIWFVLLTALLAGLAAALRWPNGWFALAAVGTVLCVWPVSAPGFWTVWSPYQKLTVRPFHYGPGSGTVPDGYNIEANGIPYQGIVNLSDSFIRAHPRYLDLSLARYSHYNMAFEFKRDIHRVLIVGAGTGNNAAAALRHGADQIDCVEIDPAIYSLGKELHPEHPYDSPRVHMYLTDARAYLKQATGPYDLIWFGLLDTHPGSSYNNRRLDHYVYTLESFQEARRLLDSDGVFLMNFAARRPWISDRLLGMVRDVFGHQPIAFLADNDLSQYGVSGELTLVAANRSLAVDDLPTPWLREYIKTHEISLPGTTRPTTDDWPYLYLERLKIPNLYLLISTTILAVVWLTRRLWIGDSRRMDWHFFALGAAFLLLEVQTISRATLLFGMTWIVNAIVISAVLLMILFANLIAWRWPRLPQPLIVTGLAITIGALVLTPLDVFNSLTYTTKLFAASGFLTAPVFFAGLVFIQSFAGSPDKATALGSNLLGALLGGLLESISFITGIRALVVLVGLFYLLAMLRRPTAIQG